MRSSAGLVLVKLGGSVITYKRRPRTIRRQRLVRLAAELASASAVMKERVVLGHGSGSFGHMVAARYGVHRGITGPDGARGAARTQHEAAALHRAVMSALLDAGVAAWSISPSSCMVADGGTSAGADVEPLRQALDAGFTPVTHGDVVMDRSQGSAIFSTETALITILRELKATENYGVRALWMGDTDGVWDDDGKTIDAITLADREALDGFVGGAEATDVTGGMRHRLDSVFELAALGVDSWILDGRQPGVLASALAGEPVGGTHVRA